MWINSSSITSIIHPNFSSINTIPPQIRCYIMGPSAIMYALYFIIDIIVFLPLCIIVLHLGFQQLRRQQSTSRRAIISHSDYITLHMVIIELIGVLGFIICSFSVFTLHVKAFSVGYYLWSFTWYGEMFFNVLTCMERYLAVAHPIIYMRRRSDRGIRIRNISIGCVWLLCIGGASLMSLNRSTELNMFLYVLFLIAISFWSFSVLCVLIHPGPGMLGRYGESLNQSKQRAFYTIVAIQAMLSIRFSWNTIWGFLYLSDSMVCIIVASGVWCNFPSSLILPLLYLHKEGIFTKRLLPVT